jgi:hypothetical protein
MGTENLTGVLDDAGVDYELLPHVHTESAAGEAKALGVPPGEVGKTLVVRTADGYVRIVMPASERLDLHKLRLACGGSKTTVQLASEADPGARLPRVRARRRGPDRRQPPRSGARRQPAGAAGLGRARGRIARRVAPYGDAGSPARQCSRDCGYLRGLTPSGSSEDRVNRTVRLQSPLGTAGWTASGANRGCGPV